MTEYSSLTRHERLQRCRELAEDARIAAQWADTRCARHHYLTIAAQWAGITADIKRRQEIGEELARMRLLRRRRGQSSRVKEPTARSDEFAHLPSAR